MIYVTWRWLWRRCYGICNQPINNSWYTAATFNQSNADVWNDATSLLTDGTVSDIYIRLKGSPNGAARVIRVTTSHWYIYY